MYKVDYKIFQRSNGDDYYSIYGNPVAYLDCGFDQIESKVNTTVKSNQKVEIQIVRQIEGIIIK